MIYHLDSPGLQKSIPNSTLNYSGVLNPWSVRELCIHPDTRLQQHDVVRMLSVSSVSMQFCSSCSASLPSGSKVLALAIASTSEPELSFTW